MVYKAVNIWIFGTGERAGGIKGIVKEVLADLKSSYLVFG